MKKSEVYHNFIVVIAALCTGISTPIFLNEVNIAASVKKDLNWFVICFPNASFAFSIDGDDLQSCSTSIDFLNNTSLFDVIVFRPLVSFRQQVF